MEERQRTSFNTVTRLQRQILSETNSVTGKQVIEFCQPRIAKIKHRPLQTLAKASQTISTSLSFILIVIQIFLCPLNQLRAFQALSCDWRFLQQMLSESKALVNLMKNYRVDVSMNPIRFQLALPFLLDERCLIRKLGEISSIASGLGVWVWYITWFELNRYVAEDGKTTTTTVRISKKLPLPKIGSEKIVKQAAVIKLLPVPPVRLVIKFGLSLRGVFRLVRCVIEGHGISVVVSDTCGASSIQRSFFLNKDPLFPEISTRRLLSAASETIKHIIAQWLFYYCHDTFRLENDPGACPEIDSEVRYPFGIHLLVYDGTQDDACVICEIGMATVFADTTLFQLRKAINQCKELTFPSRSYCFVYRNTRVSRLMEKRRLVIFCLPLLRIVCRENRMQPLSKAFYFSLNRLDICTPVLPSPMAPLQSALKVGFFNQLVINEKSTVIEVEKELGLLFEDWTSVLSFKYGGLNDGMPISVSPKRRKRFQFESKLKLREKQSSMAFPTKKGSNNSLRPIGGSEPKYYDPYGRKSKSMVIKKKRAVPLYICMEYKSPNEFWIPNCPNEKLQELIQVGTKLRFEDSNDVTVSEIILASEDEDNNTVAASLTSKKKYRGKLKKSSLWKVLSEKRDSRPLWLDDIQFNVHHPVFDFEVGSLLFVHFKYQLSYFAMESIIEAEQWSKDVSWQKYIDELSITPLIDAIYARLCSLHPRGDHIDGLKFSKMVRKSDMITKKESILSMAKVDLMFTANRDSKTLKLSKDGFVKCLDQISSILYPNISDLMKRLQTLFLKNMILSDRIRDIWLELIDMWRLGTKISVMKTRVVPICAASRIQTTFRRYFHEKQYRAYRVWYANRWKAAQMIQTMPRMVFVYRPYTFFRTGMIYLQAYVRMHFTRIWYLKTLAERELNMTLRLQRWVRVRLFRIRIWFKINESWIKRRDKARAKKSRLIYRKARTMYGSNNIFIVSIYNSHFNAPKDRRCTFEIHNAETAETLIIEHTNSEIREVVHKDTTRRYHPLHIFRDEKDFDTFLNRLELVNNATEAIIRSDSQQCCQGRFLFCGGYDILRNFYILRFYKRYFQLEVEIYSVTSSTTTSKKVDQLAVYAANCEIKESHPIFTSPSFFSTCSFGLIKVFNNDVETLCRKVARYVLKYNELMEAEKSAIRILSESRELKEMQVEDKRCSVVRRINVMACRIQRILRRYTAKIQLIIFLKSIYQKQWDRDAGQYCYYNLLLHKTTWTKPLLFGQHEDAPDPQDVWEETHGSAGHVYYYNPAKGQTSWMNDIQAAKVLQKWVRSFRHRDIGHTSIGLMVRAMKFHIEIEDAIEASDGKTTVEDIAELQKNHTVEFIIHYALHLHLLNHKYQPAYLIYNHVLKQYPEHPIVSGALAILLLVTVRPPAKVSWKRANNLLSVVHQNTDPDVVSERYNIEEACFRWAALIDNENGEALANLALYHQCITHQYDKAERLYRRAVFLHPNNQPICTNYFRFLKERLPGGIYAGGGPGRVTRQRSTVVEECEDEWYLMKDPEAATDSNTAYFYWNRKTDATSWMS